MSLALLAAVARADATSTTPVVAAAPVARAVPMNAAQGPADFIIRDARVYDTASGEAPLRSVAIRAGKIIAIGAAGDRARGVGSSKREASDRAREAGDIARSTSDISRWKGPGTLIENADGHLLLPGLIDSHIHPTDIVDFDLCDLENRAMSLADLSAFVKACIAHFQPRPGEWFHVFQWNSSEGNRPDARFATLRAALDAASKSVLIQAEDSDGHHSAYNSAGLAQGRNARGERVGLSKATLKSDFSPYAQLIGVDANGEPDGIVGERARNVLGYQYLYSSAPDRIIKVPWKIAERLNAAGITAVLDAEVPQDALPLYDALEASGRLTFHAMLAQFFEPERFERPDGGIDYERMIALAKATRAHYAGHPLIRAEVVKLFTDGVLEGNPLAYPPTLPNGAVLEPFLQPIFRRSGDALSVAGYADPQSAFCREVRASPQRFTAAADIAAFESRHGFHPAQCAISNGRLEHDREIILEFAKRFHQAGFALHIHVIGDRSVRTAVDAIEAARASDGVMTRDALAHTQLVHPDDVLRIGKDRLYVAMTHAWESDDAEYDLKVIPFIDRVMGNDLDALHPRAGYYERNAYPSRGLRDAGAILLGGSDAPVDSRDPRPFVNIAHALTRRNPGGRALNISQAITLRDVLDSYTINGARYLGLEDEAGSIEVGKSADLVLTDRNILELARRRQADDIAKTRVLATWFRGVKVYSSATAR